MNKQKIMIGLLTFFTILIVILLLFEAKNIYFDRMLRIVKPENWKWNDNCNRSKINIIKNQYIPINEKLLKPDVIKPAADYFSYKESLQMSSETGKPILVFFTAKWCDYCNKMKLKTLPQKEVQDILKNYIVSYVDINENVNLSKKFEIKSIPSYVITNYKEKKIKFNKGFMDSNSFVKWLNDAKLFIQPKKEN